MSKAIAMTQHGRMRANSRGFSNALIELIRDHGTWVGERLVLDSCDLRAFVEVLNATRAHCIRLLDKGGGTVVFGEDDELITIFSPRTYRPSRRSRRTFLEGI